MLMRTVKVCVAAFFFAGLTLHAIEHDEPIVVDNGPFRIDLGRHATAQPDGTWRREFTSFAQLTIRVSSDGNEFGLPETYELCARCALTFVLRDDFGIEVPAILMSDPTTETLTMRAPSRRIDGGAGDGWL